jgi:NAD(P)H dehydrogenase (quinone)
MTHIAIVSFSGYGHTKKQAEAVAEGVSKSGAKAHMIEIDKDGNMQEGVWETLESADGIIFGAPTYMGGPAWQFKKFADASSKPWFQMKWKDKVAAGFTNSASINGDKFATISYFQTLAMQHSMVWIGTGLMPSNSKAATRNDINWLGGFGGALAQSPSDASPEEGPLPGDLETAKLFGERVAQFAARMREALQKAA